MGNKVWYIQILLIIIISGSCSIMSPQTLNFWIPNHSFLRKYVVRFLWTSGQRFLSTDNALLYFMCVSVQRHFTYRFFINWHQTYSQTTLHLMPEWSTLRPYCTSISALYGGAFLNSNIANKGKMKKNTLCRWKEHLFTVWKLKQKVSASSCWTLAGNMYVGDRMFPLCVCPWVTGKVLLSTDFVF